MVDTAQALQLREASALILQDLERLREVLARAFAFKDTPMIGRTHGMHAEPTTFGLKLANWYAEIGRNLERFALPPKSCASASFPARWAPSPISSRKWREDLRTAGTERAPVTSQVIQRDRHAAYLCTLAVIASTLDKIATEIRHLQRTEVREAEEFFSERQKGSSAMPHKRNPVTCEQISGLARVVRANAQAALENVALWHERDISHSSVERVILPDSTILVDYLLHKTANLIENLLVYPERMRRTWKHRRAGLQRTIAARSGGSRRAARGSLSLVQRNAMRAWNEGLNFRELIERSRHHRPGVAGDPRPSLRSAAPVAQCGQDFPARLREVGARNSGPGLGTRD